MLSKFKTSNLLEISSWSDFKIESERRPTANGIKDAEAGK
jgi:hypothetical protein